MPRPNLFTHATSELSQDAVLAWLLHWAHPAHAGSASADDRALHAAGRRFVDLLLDRLGWTLLDPNERVDVRTQWQNIDVLVHLPDRGRALVIEDKVHADDTHNPLPSYRAAAARYAGCTPEEVGGVYLKTGIQSCFDRVNTHGFVHVSRGAVLQALDVGTDGSAAVRSDIYGDFVAHLRALDDAFGAWQRRLPRSDPPAPATGHDLAWRGLMDALQAKLGGGGWHDVSNARGGYVIFHLHVTTVDGRDVYVQAQSDLRLGIRINLTTATDRGGTRRHWQQVLRAAATPDLPYVAPPHPRTGRTSEISTSTAPTWVVPAPAGGVDLDATAAVLVRYRDFAQDAIAHHVAARSAP
ncbi:MAG: PD-(D/E)XK nuclease family protein [Alphaproteobacteria bacterium]|nr:PD-(D/E)XK nuclease family protein [Alphaproteobacteria bacterium]